MTQKGKANLDLFLFSDAKITSNPRINLPAADGHSDRIMLDLFKEQ